MAMCVAARLFAPDRRCPGLQQFTELGAGFQIALRDLGIHFGEYWFLEDLADDCARDGVYEFLLVAPAMPVMGGTGSPVNPIAIK